MQNDDQSGSNKTIQKYHTGHLQTRIILFVVLVTTSIFLLQGVYEYSKRAANIPIELDIEGNNIVNRLTQSLVMPLWDLDDNTLERIVDSELVNKNVYSIILIDPERRVYLGKQRDKNWNITNYTEFKKDDYLLAWKDISMNGRTIGQVKVFLTDKFLQNELTRKTYIQSLQWIATNALLVLVLIFILQRNLLVPVLSLVSTVQKISRTRDYTLRADRNAPGELGLLCTKINDMLAEIEDRDRQLQIYNEKLEQLVNERTAELGKANSELIAARDKAEDASRTKSQFLANMSHEIRTPMNAIIGLTDLAIRSEPPKKISGYLDIIRSSARSLLGLINDILDFSKVEAGHLDLEDSQFLLQPLLEEVTDMYLEKCAAKGLELILEVGTDVPNAFIGDPLRLRQILVNLAGNAVKFTDTGEIHLGCKLVSQEDDAAQLHFSVRDTGIGIPEDTQKKLFSAFTQADTSTTRKYGGTGLGLAISKRLVEMMGGEMVLESETGKGSTFSFTVNLQIDNKNSDQAYSMPPTMRDMRVLIVDDNPTQLCVLEEMLISFGFRVDSALDATQALNLLEQCSKDDPYKLLFLDWRMPETNGIELATIISQNPSYKDTPIVMLTAFGREREMKAAAEAGVDTFLLKPVKHSLLFNSIMEQFGHKEKAPKGSSKRIKDKGLLDLRRYSKARILLVEDNIFNQEVAREMLKLYGMTTTIANNGQEAIDLIRHTEEPFHIILMDIQMPVMDGFETTQHIRNALKLNDIPIVAMTAHAIKGYKDTCLKAGMNDYISKPIEQKDLQQTLLRWLPKTCCSANDEKVIVDPRLGVDEPAHKQQDVDKQSEVSSEFTLAASSTDLLDIENGLSRVSNNMDLYSKLVIDFCHHYMKTADALEKYINSGEYKTAKQTAHDIKGASGNIGAIQLNKAAENLESALETPENPALATTLSSFRTSLDALTEFVLEENSIFQQNQQKKKSEEQESSQSDLQAGDIGNLIIELYTAISNRDPINAESRANDIANILSENSLISSEIKQLEESVGNYDFDTAQNLLKEIGKALDLPLTA